MPMPDRAARGYAVSTFAKTLTWSAADAFSLFFLTNVLFIAAPLAGALVLGFMVWGAVADLIAAALIERAGIGRSAPPRRFYAVTAAAASILFALTFTPLPPGWPTVLLAAGFGAGFRLAYSLMDVPHNAMLGDLAERANPVRIAALRLVSAIAGSLVVTTLGARMLTAAAGLPQRAEVYGGGVALAAGALFVLFNPVRIAGRPGAPAARSGGHEHGRFPLVLGLFLVGEIGLALISGLISKSVVYLAATVVVAPNWAATAFALMLLGKLMSAGAWTLVRRRPPLALWSSVGFIGLGLTAAVLAGMKPGPMTLDAAFLLLGFGVGGVNQLGWGLMAELTAGLARRNLAFGLFTSVGKVGAGLSALVLGFLLKPQTAGAAADIDLFKGLLTAIVATSATGAVCLALVHQIRRRLDAEKTALQPPSPGRSG